MALLIYTNAFHSFFQHQSSLIFPLLTDPAFKNTIQSQMTPYDITQHDTHQLKITLNIHRYYICLDFFFLWMSSTIASIRHSCSVSTCPSNLHISLFLCLNSIHTNTCLQVLDQGWESISTSWLHFNSVTKCFELSESGQTLNTCLRVLFESTRRTLRTVCNISTGFPHVLDFSRHF